MMMQGDGYQMSPMKEFQTLYLFDQENVWDVEKNVSDLIRNKLGFRFKSDCFFYNVKKAHMTKSNTWSYRDLNLSLHLLFSFTLAFFI